MKTAETTRLELATLEMPAATLGPENPLPSFRHVERALPLLMDDTLPPDIAAALPYGDLWRVLPYRMQDGYDRERRPTSLQTVVLENDRLRATFVPALGGRLWSLVDKRTGRDLVTCNAVFQPAGLALRNAWFSGGIEWNTPCPGHSLLTCTPVHAARVQSAAGYPILRLYAWDRVQRFPWAIDVHLPPGSPVLFTRVRLINVHDHEIPMYWWTNIAVDEIPGGRVLFPADHAIAHRVGGALGAITLRDTSPDPMVATSSRNAAEYYGLLRPERRPWVVSVAPDGTGIFHASTWRLRGRKMFCWGMAPGGRRWQELLSPGRPYTEIQAGLAQTQQMQVPMPAHAEWSWVEAFGAYAAPAAAVHSCDWTSAWQAAEVILDGLLPQARLEELDRTLTPDGRKLPAEVLARGEGWGALERRRCAVTGTRDPVPPEWVFPASDLDDEQGPWLALLEQGALPECSPHKDPMQGMVQPEWTALLETAVAAGRGDHWVAWLHLGNMRMEALDSAGAAQAWRCSIERMPNCWAYRNLAEHERREGRTQAACECMAMAWRIGPTLAKLAIEYAKLLAHSKRFSDLRVFCRGLPADLCGNERIRIHAAQAALAVGAFDEVEPLFDHSFTTIFEGEAILTDLWFELHARRLSESEGVSLDEALYARVRTMFPPPANIDFRLVSESATAG